MAQVLGGTCDLEFRAVGYPREMQLPPSQILAGIELQPYTYKGLGGSSCPSRFSDLPRALLYGDDDDGARTLRFVHYI